MLVLDKEAKKPLYLQLYDQLQEEILTGVLKEGSTLQGSRQLAQTLQVSRNTVDNAYSMLAAEGYILPKRGVGYQVARLPRLAEAKIPGGEGPKSAAARDKDSHKDRDMDKARTGAGGCVKGKKQAKEAATLISYDLTNSSHTSDLFPKRLWRKYTLAALDRLDKEASLSMYLHPQGELFLRQHLRSYLARIRGVRCCEEQMIITSGLQQSLDIVCKLIGSQQQIIVMEEPGYNKAAAVFQNNGLQVAGVPVDEYGLRVDLLPKGKEAAAVYCTPSHQFPTGGVMPIGRRYELLNWAQQQNAFILADDYDSELQYYAKPIPSLQALDMHDRVIYLGTFSKGLSPSIRMGYLILPQQLLDRYAEQFANYNSTVPLINQYVIGALIADGQYDRHIRRLSNVFRKRMNCFTRELAQALGEVRIIGNSRAQYCLLEFPKHLQQEMLLEAAAKQGVRVYSTMQFWQEKAACPPNTLFLGLCKIKLEEIPDCVSRLQAAWADLL